ncbi:MAG: hypothetical protein A2V86_02255 [Deltaproteobacteria bacterium RBG_16_49_23]|nr:MAG: hypothetical protein A2V86_02255 [Deltaproteobacteria bacterium RBG_16_49_23]
MLGMGSPGSILENIPESTMNALLLAAETHWDPNLSGPGGVICWWLSSLPTLIHIVMNLIQILLLRKKSFL